MVRLSSQANSPEMVDAESSMEGGPTSVIKMVGDQHEDSLETLSVGQQHQLHQQEQQGVIT